MNRDRPVMFFAGVLLLSQMIGITKRSLWADEAYVGLMVNEPWHIFAGKLETDIHHPLYIVVMKIWSMVAGHSEFALRIFSVIALVIGFCIFWRLISETDSPVAARWTALFFIFSPAVLLYGRMARYYSLSWLLFVLGLWLLHKWGDQPGRLLALWYYLVMTASWYLTEPLGVIGATHFLLLPRGSRLRPGAFGTWSLSAVTYGIWFWVWRDRLGEQLGGQPSPLSSAFYREWGLKFGFTLYQSLWGETVPAFWVIGVTVVVALILGGAGLRRPVSRYLLFTLIWLPAMIALATYPIRVGIDFVPARVFFLVPGLFWLLGRGVAGFPSTVQAPIALFLLSPMAVGMGLTYDRANSITSTYVTPWREMTREIMRIGRPEDWVLADEVPYLYYRERFGGGGPRVSIVTVDSDIERVMDTLADEFPPRIFVLFNPRDITGGKMTDLLEWLKMGYDLVKAVPVVTETPAVTQVKSRFAPSPLPVKRELRIYRNIQIAGDPFAMDRIFNLPEVPVMPEPETSALSDGKPSPKPSTEGEPE